MGRYEMILLVVVMLWGTLCLSLPHSDNESDMASEEDTEGFLDKIDFSLGDMASNLSEFVNKIAFVQAVADNNLNGVKTQLGEGVSVNNSVAIIIAIATGNLDMVNTLIEAGADVNMEEGLPLVTAAGLGNAQIVNALISADADPAYFSDAKTAAEYANNSEIVQILRDESKHHNVSERSEDMTQLNNDFTLIRAVANNDPKMIDELLSQGANATKALAFAIAILKENQDIVKTLIARGGDVNFMEGDLLVTAAGLGKTDIAKALIEAGALKARSSTLKFGLKDIALMLANLFSKLISTTQVPVL